MNRSPSALRVARALLPCTLVAVGLNASACSDDGAATPTEAPSNPDSGHGADGAAASPDAKGDAVMQGDVVSSDGALPGKDTGIVPPDSASLPAGPWLTRGVGGGGAFFVPAISPFDEQLWMATDMGAVFHSVSFGTAWVDVNFHNLPGGRFSQVRFTSEPSVLYGIGSVADVGKAFKSTDGGTTFTMLDDSVASELVYIEADPMRSDRLLVSNYGTLYFSSNGGQSFSQVYAAADSGTGLLLGGAFWDGSTIYVGTNDGLLVSSNGGTSFALEGHGGIGASESIVSFAGAKQGTTTRFFAVTSSGIWADESRCEMSGGKVYKLDVGQSAWTNVSGVPAGHDPVIVGMAAGDTSVAYISGRNGNDGAPSVCKTADGGTTWQSVFKAAGNANIATGWSGVGGDTGWGYGECAEGFTVSTADPNRVAVTDMGFIHVTKDGGTSWHQAYLEPADENPAGANTPKGKAYHGVGAEDTSVWWLTWPDSSTVFASFTDITSIRSTDSGVTWSRDSQNGLSLNTTYQALLSPSGTMYAPTSPVHDMYMSYRLADAQLDATGGAVMQSIDKGAHFTTLHSFGQPVVFLALDPNDPKSMYASVVNHTSGGIYRTTNLDQGASATWTKLASPPRTEGHPYAIVVLKDGTVVATYSGRRTTTFTVSAGVFVLPSGATAWTDRSDAAMQYWVKDLVVDPNDATESTWYVGVFQAWGVTAAQDTNGLYRTTDRGQTWKRIWAGHNVESVAIDPANASKMFVTTESEGLFATTNLGASSPTFSADPDYPFAHPLRVFFNPFKAGETWVASFGGGLRVRQF